jgi:hypothetical protein
MIYTALSHRNSPHQRTGPFPIYNGEGTTDPVMPDVRTPTGFDPSPPDGVPRRKLEAPSAEQNTLGASRQRCQGLTTGDGGHCLNHIRTPVAQCRYLNSDLSLTERPVASLLWPLI